MSNGLYLTQKFPTRPLVPRLGLLKAGLGP